MAVPTVPEERAASTNSLRLVRSLLKKLLIIFFVHQAASVTVAICIDDIFFKGALKSEIDLLDRFQYCLTLYKTFFRGIGENRIAF